LLNHNVEHVDDSTYRPNLVRSHLISIVDADQGTCEALGSVFALEGFRITIAIDARNVVSNFKNARPDVLILNLRVGAENGVDVLHAVKSLHTATPVFMLADTPDLEAAVSAMKLGAVDVIKKPLDTVSMTRRIRDELRRDVHFSAMNGGRRVIEVRGFSQLTPREREVLQLITNGQSNKGAGRELGISPRTIEVHRGRIMEKLGARNAADLMRIVLS
jgi:two-component system response regulator FixJ